MKRKLATSLASLEEIIAELNADLKKYAGKEGAKPHFVEKQNTLIEKLCSIYNDLDGLEMFDLWSDIEQRMKALEKQDPQIDSHCIVIQLKPGEVRNTSFIKIIQGTL